MSRDSEIEEAASKMQTTYIDYEDNAGNRAEAPEFWRVFVQARDAYKKLAVETDNEWDTMKARVDELEARLKQANYLIAQLLKGHEGAEGWSEYLTKTLAEYDGSA